jgi:hypothetical protein
MDSSVTQTVVPLASICSGNIDVIPKVTLACCASRVTREITSTNDVRFLVSNVQKCKCEYASSAQTCKPSDEGKFSHRKCLILPLIDQSDLL